MKNRFPLFVLLFLFFPLILLAVFFWWKWATGPADPNNKTEKIFIIRKDEPVKEIINDLEEGNLIKNSLAFRIILKKEKLESKIQAGDFHLSPGMNSRDIALQLTEGRLDVWATIPEGRRKEEIYQILKREGFNFDYPEWLALTKNKEGYLFPETYLIPNQASASAVVKIMVDTFDTKTKEFSDKLSKDKLILASIIERETKSDKDRGLVGGILLKRLQNNWSLEVDATMQYAIGTLNCDPTRSGNDSPTTRCWWPQISGADLEMESPYNSYKNPGFPPGPICNPGFASIHAAVFPQQSDYWFYLSDKKGNMHYSETLEEHEANIEKYLN